MAGESQRHKRKKTEAFFFFFIVFIFPVGFLLRDSFCFQLSLLRGEQRKGEISGEVSFYSTLLSETTKKKLENSKRQRQICGRDDRKGDVGRKNVKAWDEKKEKSLAEQRGDTVNRRYRILKLGYGERSNFFLPRLKPRQFPQSYTHTQIIHTIWCFIAWNLN